MWDPPGAGRCAGDVWSAIAGPRGHIREVGNQGGGGPSSHQFERERAPSRGCAESADGVVEVAEERVGVLEAARVAKRLSKVRRC